MTRSLYEPSLYSATAKNSFGVQSLKQKPEALRWWEPDCAVGPGCTGDEPVLDNGFAQPTGDLELFAFRLNADGLIQTKGILDASGGSNGGIAWVMPGAVAGETDLIPPTTANDTFALRVTTTGDEAGIVGATAYVDNATGDVIIRWSTSTPSAGWGIPDLILSAGATQTLGDFHCPVPWEEFSTPWVIDTPFDTSRYILRDGENFFRLTQTDDQDPQGIFRWEVTHFPDWEGWWASELITGWDQVGTPGEAGHEIASVMQRIYWTTSVIAWSPSDYRDYADWMIADSYDGGNLVINSFGFMDSGELHTIMAPHWLEGGATWQATGIHRTGNTVAERGLSGIMWKFWYLGADDLSGWTWDFTTL